MQSRQLVQAHVSPDGDSPSTDVWCAQANSWNEQSLAKAEQLSVSLR